MRIKLFLLLAFLALNVQAATVVTNVSRLSGFGFVSSLKSTDFVAISVRQDASLTNDRLRAIIGTNFVNSLTNLGIASTGFVNLRITNAVLIAAGTNIFISTNVTGSNITYTINVGTNAGGSSVSPPLSSVQYNSNSVLSGSSSFVFTNSMVGIGTNIPAYPLHLFVANNALTALEISYTNGAGNTVAMQVRNGTGATNFQVEVGGLVRSVTVHNSGSVTSDVVSATSLNVLGGTLGAGKVLTDSGGTGAATWQAATGDTNTIPIVVTNNVKVTAGTNIVVVTNISGSVITYQVNNGIDTNIFATTNFVSSAIGSFINLSVQAAKLPATNYPGIDAGWQNWELLFPPTNSVGFTNPLAATWQFVCPTNYTTNSMKVYGQSIILSTNGPTATNIYWRASIFKATPGDTNDIHVGAFGSSVTVTQTWAASNTGTNKMQDFLIDLSTSSLLQRNDFAILKLERVNDIADTNQFKGSASLIGLQLRY